MASCVRSSSLSVSVVKRPAMSARGSPAAVYLLEQGKRNVWQQ